MCIKGGILFIFATKVEIMTWIIILLLIGVLLLFLEIFFVPGTTIVGVIGGIFAAIAIYLAFKEHGNMAGYISLAVTLVVMTILIIIGAKTGVWQKLSNKDAIKSKVLNVDENELKTGDTGTSISALRPSGKARFGNRNYEVTSYGEYIEPNSRLEIISISGNKIFVKSGNTEEQASDK